MKSIESRLIHGSAVREAFGALKTPLFVNSAFEFENSESMADAFQGRSQAHAYSRITNPTVSELQERLKDMGGAQEALCLSSGMAAISAVLTSILSSGDRVLTAPWLFGNTLSLLNNTLPPYGVECDYVDMRDLQAVEKAIRPETRCLLVENLSNPQLILADMEGLSTLCRRKNIILIADNSLLTPYLCRSSRYNVDVEVFSTTKFISGGATGIGGAILFYPSDKWQYGDKLKPLWEEHGEMALYRKVFFEVFRNQGGCMAPQNAWLQLLGLETLALRARQAQNNATKVADFLETQSAVKRVLFPGLSTYPQKDLALDQLQGNTGQMILLDLADQAACYRFMDRLKMIRRATNFCDNKSLIIHPASTIYGGMSEEDILAMGFSSASLRLSVGIEDPADILDDLKQALVGLE